MTCQSLKEVLASNLGAAHGNSGSGNAKNGGTHGTAPNGVSTDPIMNVAKRIYTTGQKALTNCAFIKDLFGFQRCIKSLMREYDLRKFFGGMRCYHDCEAMARRVLSMS